MGTRKRVKSLLSQFRDSKSPTPTTTPVPAPVKDQPEAIQFDSATYDVINRPLTPPIHPRRSMTLDTGESPQPRPRGERPTSNPSRPLSMVQAYQPPLMDVNADTLPELQPIFTYLNSHGNKLYQEGYFLKLDDQNIHGRPNTDRIWTECFAQLVGTVLSLWDAAELDAAGQDGEVLPKFINLTDASIKMIESLPTRSSTEQPLQNVLSISTAGKNRYLLHFNSHHSLLQWTAGIRLAMFEHVGLQEAYTGALIAGKGRQLNNIPIIMERLKMPYATWARVRFGAGTPWRRCWCVVSPPDEKEVQKVQKQLKKKSPYDRSRPPVLKGDVKFFDNKKTKRTRPIATITDAYSAFAIYPQSKPLIDASTLIKVEGSITIHSSPPTASEGFVFVMPEVPPAVTGFEIMLRWLFPVLDTFALYGRPGKLIADTLDQKGLMFAMPKHRRYGYLEILDVTSLALEDGSSNWKEAEWRKKMKELTARRMTAIESAGGSRRNSRYSTRRSRNSFGPLRSRVQFDDAASSRSTPAISWSHEAPQQDVHPITTRVDSAPAAASGFVAPHHRSVSEAQGLDRLQNQSAPSYDGAQDRIPVPPPHTVPVVQPLVTSTLKPEKPPTPERVSSEDEQNARTSPVRELQELQTVASPEPVAPPPAFAHGPGAVPASRPYHSPELRRANSRMSTTTLSQLANVGGAIVLANEKESTVLDAEEKKARPQGQDDAPQIHDVGTQEQAGISQGNGIDRRQGDGVQDQTDGAREKVADTQDEATHRQEDLSRAKGQGTIFGEQIAKDSSPRMEDADQSGVRLYVRTKEHPANRDALHQGPINSSSPQRALQQLSSPIANPDIQHSRRPSKPLVNPFLSQEANSRRLGSPNQSHTLDRRSHDTYPKTTPTSTSSLSHQQESVPRGLGTSIEPRPSQFPKPIEPHAIARKPVGTPPSDSSYTFPPRASSTQAVKFAAQESQNFRVEEERLNVNGRIAADDSPSYVVRRQPAEVQRSPDKPRAGVLKTVGQLDSVSSQLNQRQQLGSDLNIDFGPTINYASQRFQGLPRAPAPDISPSNSPRRDYRQSRSPGVGHAVGPKTPQHIEERPNSSGNPMSSNPDNISPDTQQNRPGSSQRRSVQWLPGTNAASGRPRSMTPEEFVQQRAAAANAPMYSHHRQQSSSRDINRAITPTIHSRHSSYDLTQRPSSRGSSKMLGTAAYEQDQTTRLSSQPLLSMTQNTRPGRPGGGLVGAIEARAQEKQQLKQGLNDHAVEQAYFRNQQAHYQQQAEQQLVQYTYGQGQFSGNVPLQRQQRWTPEGPSGYHEGWPTSEGRQLEHPRTYPLLQQPYFDQYSQYPQQQYWDQGRTEPRYGGAGR